MAWVKKGLIFHTDNTLPWMVSRASFPTALLLGDVIRIYFSCVGPEKKSLMTFVDVDAANPTQIIRLNERPLIEPGRPGTFDDSGTQPNCVLEHEGKVYLYYLGWNLAVTVSTRNNTGLAISEDGGATFRKAFEGPVLDRNIHEPYFAYTPFILIEDGVWHCWYGSGTGWEMVNGKTEGHFEIKYATSQDGIHWERPNITCIHPAYPSEVNCRPTLVKDGDTYKMWYSYRGMEGFRDGRNSYRIGYAESKDRVTWERLDGKAGLDVSPTGWDQEMVGYCSVIDVGERRLMFYNGNGFGATGFGYAEWAP